MGEELDNDFGKRTKDREEGARLDGSPRFKENHNASQN